MNIENELKRLSGIKFGINSELDEVYLAFEHDEPYFADVEMYENALLKANELGSMASSYLGEIIFLRKKLADKERESE